MTIKIPIFPDAWLTDEQLGPLYTNEAHEALRVMRSPDSTPADRDAARLSYAEYESDQMSLADGYAEALVDVVKALARAYEVGEVQVVIWTVDGEDPPGVTPSPEGVPPWMTHQRTLSGLARSAVTVQRRGSWQVVSPEGVVFEL